MNRPDRDTTKIQSLDKIIDRNPLIIQADLSIIKVLNLMYGIEKDKESIKKNDRLSFDNTLQKKSSYALVMKEQKIIGIFTERDLVKLIADRVDFADRKIAEVMTANVITLEQDCDRDIWMAVAIMRENKIRHLPIVDSSGQLIGVVTQASIRSSLTPGYLLQMRSVADVMSSPVIHCFSNVLLIDIARLMEQYRISCIVIVEKKTTLESDRLLTVPVGIVTERDLVKFRVLELNFEITPVSTVMSQPLFPVNREDSLWEANQLMDSKKLRRLVVVEKSGELAGIVTQTSILKVFDPREMSQVINLLQFQVDRKTTELQEIKKQLENQLYMTRSRLRNLLASSPAIIYSRNIEKKRLPIGFISENVNSILGYQSSNFMHDFQFWSDRIHPEDRDRVLDELSEILDNCEGASEYRFRHQKGHYLWLRDRLRLVRNSAGEAIELVGYWIDITEKKQMETQLFHSQRLEILGTLASGIAHDFNNILTPIISIAQILPLKFTNLDPQTQKLFSFLEDNSKRGAELVEQILSFARKASGEPIDLQISNLLWEIVQISRTTFPKSIEISLNLPSDRNLSKVLGNNIQLYQVFMNLCVNARDAMADGGNLTISVENVFIDRNFIGIDNSVRVGSYVVVSVTDTGTGIPDRIKKRIFEPFFTTKEAVRGTGLGLSTVMTIIKNHKGFVKVYSELGTGTQFKVYLPALEVVPPKTETELQLVLGDRELILIVDDEATIREMTKVFLEKYNYRTLLANDGMEAITLYQTHQHKIDLVLMDLIMPSMDGFTAIESLRAIDPDVKIIATSGFVCSDRLEALHQAGVREFLSKPYTVTDLLNILHQSLAPNKIDF